MASFSRRSNLWMKTTAENLKVNLRRNPGFYDFWFCLIETLKKLLLLFVFCFYFEKSFSAAICHRKCVWCVHSLAAVISTYTLKCLVTWLNVLMISTHVYMKTIFQCLQKTKNWSFWYSNTYLFISYGRYAKLSISQVCHNINGNWCILLVRRMSYLQLVTN